MLEALWNRFTADLSLSKRTYEEFHEYSSGKPAVNVHQFFPLM
jgi:hypothetical protein